jgi:hypothetical protein
MKYCTTQNPEVRLASWGFTVSYRDFGKKRYRLAIGLPACNAPIICREKEVLHLGCCRAL